MCALHGVPVFLVCCLCCFLFVLFILAYLFLFAWSEKAWREKGKEVGGPGRRGGRGNLDQNISYGKSYAQ